MQLSFLIRIKGRNSQKQPREMSKRSSHKIKSFVSDLACCTLDYSWSWIWLLWLVQAASGFVPIRAQDCDDGRTCGDETSGLREQEVGPPRQSSPSGMVVCIKNWKACLRSSFTRVLLEPPSGPCPSDAVTWPTRTPSWTPSSANLRGRVSLNSSQSSSCKQSCCCWCSCTSNKCWFLPLNVNFKELSHVVCVV